MAIGTYGTVRPSDVSPEDVEIILNYTPSRDVTNDFVLKTLNASTILRPYYNNSQTNGNSGLSRKALWVDSSRGQQALAWRSSVNC